MIFLKKIFTVLVDHESPLSHALALFCEPLWAAMINKDVTHYAVATSGGPDSLVLTVLLDAYLKKHHQKLTALTVDHGLRPESSYEAQHVATFCAQQGIPHVTLKATDLPVGTMHAKARKQRYRALSLWCHQQGVKHLFLGHHRDDQLETFGFRVLRRSGVHGWGGMKAHTLLWGLHLLRPLLSLTKKEIMHAAHLLDLPFVRDPSNTHPRFTRARIRQSLQGLSSDQRALWSHIAHTYRQRGEQEDHASAQVLTRHLIHWQQGYARVSAARPLLTHPQGVPILRMLLTHIRGHTPHPLTTDRLRHVHAQLLLKKNVTYGGCLMQWCQEELWVMREWRRIASVPLKQPFMHMLWDDRFYLHIHAPPHLLKPWIAPLGSHERYRRAPLMMQSWPSLMEEAGEVIPCWNNDVFVACRWMQAECFPQTPKLRSHDGQWAHLGDR